MTLYHTDSALEYLVNIPTLGRARALCSKVQYHGDREVQIRRQLFDAADWVENLHQP